MQLVRTTYNLCALVISCAHKLLVVRTNYKVISCSHKLLVVRTNYKVISCAHKLFNLCSQVMKL